MARETEFKTANIGSWIVESFIPTLKNPDGEWVKAHTGFLSSKASQDTYKQQVGEYGTERVRRSNTGKPMNVGTTRVNYD